jgi:hypothetical protein
MSRALIAGPGTALQLPSGAGNAILPERPVLHVYVPVTCPDTCPPAVAMLLPVAIALLTVWKAIAASYQMN